ncbi:FliH/SctL family protein [Peribacillus glennii]|uniref:Uncharacterized protein n=1 Tax=Peribacillus glennii TaxID=2303991 RepID=A0A372L6Y4_9BACI|nr:hypothetical protein [Peribacillus glennii]RFU60906.1 hypothetical protein D0466_20230 [Peribacillus glennii]
MIAGQKGTTSKNSITSGSDAYQEGYASGSDEGYQKGSEQLENQHITAKKEGYLLGKKQDKLVVPHYASVNSLKSSYTQGFNKTIAKKDEVKKKEYIALGIKDGKAGSMNKPKNTKLKFVKLESVIP